MDTMDILRACLLDILYELREAKIPLVLGGGYGLYLKREYVLHSGKRRMIPEVEPEVRPTNDLDVFLKVEILSHEPSAQAFRDTLDRLEYGEIEAAKYYQFARNWSGLNKSVKVDLLTGPASLFDRSRVRIDKRRVKPKNREIHLHGHLTEEALGIEEQPVEIEIVGTRTNGEPYQARIELPQAYPYALMKLFAFRDHEEGSRRLEQTRFNVGDAQKHVFDLFTIVALMTEEEYNFALLERQRYADHPKRQEAADIVASYFAARYSTGILRLLEQSKFVFADQLEEFLDITKELFG